MRILISDHHHSANRGDHSIVEGMLNSLSKYFPGSSFSILSDFPEHLSFMLNGVLVKKQYFSYFNWLNIRIEVVMVYFLIGAWFFRRGLSLPFFRNTITEPYLEADILISKGGSFLSDYYVPGIVGRLFWMYFMKVLGKPVFIYAQSIGPFHRWIYRLMARYVFNKLDIITLRDEISKDIIYSLGVHRPFVYVTADAAWNIDATVNNSQLWENRLEPLPNFNKERFNVSISVRRWQYNKDQGNYIRPIAEIADWLIEKKNAQVFFISTCTGFGGYHTDDRVIAYEVVNQMKYKNDVRVLCNEYAPQEIIHFYSQMSFHIGTRMHSNILALISQTPVVAIAYEFKTHGMMKFFALEHYVIDVDDVSGKALKEKIEDLLKEKNNVQNKIIQKLPCIRKKSEKSAKIIYDYLREKGIL